MNFLSAQRQCPFWNTIWKQMKRPNILQRANSGISRDKSSQNDWLQICWEKTLKCRQCNNVGSPNLTVSAGFFWLTGFLCILYKTKPSYLKTTRWGKYPASPWLVDMMTAILVVSWLKKGVPWFSTQPWCEVSTATWVTGIVTRRCCYSTHCFALVYRGSTEGVEYGELWTRQPRYT